MSNFLRRSAQGAGVPHEKGTSNLETVAMPLPSKIVLSMGRHIGAPAAPAVAKGDQVYVGTVVGKAGGFVSADIHSGVSGTVT
ncbi:MAG: electron transport complex subunit RsxC, partial [Lawsonibacter sp.]|nr:electron transport complex subunit RsxC [Lawsonibacter sp.]